MNYELAKELKDGGFQQQSHMVVLVQSCRHGFGNHIDCECTNDEYIYLPSLSELIEECGDRFDALEISGGEKKWDARGDGEECWADTPEEAVARLWLALNKK